MKKTIKSIIIICLLISAVTLIFDHFKTSSGDKKPALTDYEKINQTIKAIRSVAHSKEVTDLKETTEWMTFDVEIIYKQKTPLFAALKNYLGKDFDSVLSNGDHLFVHLIPANGSFQIYAGDPENNNNQIYPEWKYPKMKPSAN